MQEEIRDINGKLICTGDPTTGNIKVISKGSTSKTYLAIGQEFEIEREDSFTIITRESAVKFDVKRFAGTTS